MDVNADDARENLSSLARAEERRPRTPGVQRWFVVLGMPEPVYTRTRRLEVPRMPIT
jgi:hypothetical protein